MKATEVEREFLASLANGTFKRFQLMASAPPVELQDLDFSGTITTWRSSRGFAFHCRGQWTQLNMFKFLRAGDELRRATKLVPLLVVPYLGPYELDALDEVGASGLDLGGNGLLQIPPSLYLRSSGAGNSHTARASAPTYVYRSWKLATLIPRLFVREPLFPTVQSVLDACHARMMRHGEGNPPLTLPTVSKALSQLEDDLVIARQGRESQLLHLGRLVSGLSRNYKPPAMTARFLGRTRLTQAEIWDVLDRLRPPIRAVITGRSSASHYTGMATIDLLQLYVSDAGQVAESLQAQKTEAFPNLELFETREEGVYFDAERDGMVNWSSLVQTYLELATGGAREVEMAGVLLRERLLRDDTNSLTDEVVS